MANTKWLTLGAAAALFSATPALANDDAMQMGDGAKHGEMHGEAGMHHGAAMPEHAAQPKASYGKKAKGRKVEVTVTKDGFVPAEIPAKKGEVLNLVVTRKVEKTCATELVQKEQGVFAPLPLEKPVTVTLRAPKEGPLKFSCAHGHIAANVVPQ